MSIQTILLILLTGFLAWEVDRSEPKAYPLGNTGDTLMVRIVGYGFCPMNCDADHFHTGHFEGYECEFNPCIHITINDEWFMEIIIICLDVHNGVFYLWNVDRPKLYDWSCTCVHTNGNGAR